MTENSSKKRGWLRERKTVVLYKCFTFNNNSLAPLKDNCLFYNDAMGFNDPYDCNARLIKCTKSSAFSKFRRTPTEQENVVEKGIEKANKKGIICFSPRWDNILMWAHYGNSFRGFCLGIEFDLPVHKILPSLKESPLSEYKGVQYNYSDYNLKEVCYAQDDEFPSVDDVVSLADDDSEYYDAILYHKSKDWSYEQEVRLTCDKGKGVHPVPGIIKEVLFGMRMPIEQKRILKKVIEKNNKDAFFFDTLASDSKYVVERRPTEIDNDGAANRGGIFSRTCQFFQRLAGRFRTKGPKLQ